MKNENPRQWLSRNMYLKVIIRTYDHAIDCNFGNIGGKDSPVTVREITDTQTINRIISLLKKLPTNWEMMKSFNEDIHLICIDFVENNAHETVFIYGNRIQTPSTGFLYEEGDEEKQKICLDYINSLLDA